MEIFLLHFSAIWAYTIHSFYRRRCAIRFCEQLNEYITRLDCRGKVLAEAAALLGCAAEDLGDRAAYCRRVQDWLLGSHAPREDSVSRFLTKLDEFDLNAYIRSVHFDELKVPVVPF